MNGQTIGGDVQQIGEQADQGVVGFSFFRRLCFPVQVLHRHISSMKAGVTHAFISASCLAGFILQERAVVMKASL